MAKHGYNLNQRVVVRRPSVFFERDRYTSGRVTGISHDCVRVKFWFLSRWFNVAYVQPMESEFRRGYSWFYNSGS